MKKKVLLVSFQIPYPLNSGGAVAQYFFLSAMAEKFDVTFCTIAKNNYHKSCLERLEEKIPSLKMQYLDFSQDSKKKEGLISKRFLILSKKIKSFFKSSNEEDKDRSFNLTRIDKRFVIHFEKLIEANNYDIIQLEFFDTLSLLPIMPKSLKKVFIHHEIKAKRNEFLLDENSYLNYLNKVLKSNEFSMLELADTVVVFNEEDKFFLKDLNTPIIISPFGIPDKLIFKHKASNKFNRLLFMGSQNHFPNKEGLKWFLDEIYLPNYGKVKLPIYITGDWNDQFKSKYASFKNIVFLGFLETLNEIFDHSILISPIISGSGVRTKILQAFANNVPVISTRFASEGLYNDQLKSNHIIHFENSTDFIRIADKINKDEKYLGKIAKNGKLYYSENFQKTNLINRRFQIYSN